ncbi:E3 ubiquitin-protein ligase NEURL1B isoform X2 [Dendrobates tinctorius]|uniref:E3 ubiquitin-protein ligase NEURL1B isoform X2 n=1 Tax=Dendrobates tinctorius TaxID=92724 RepID=UPI003CC94AEE
MGNTAHKTLPDTSHHNRQVANRPCYTLLHCGQERRLVLSRTESPRFHCQTKGKNIRLDTHGRKAIRRNSFCNGITFTSRPIHLYEKVRLKLVSVHHGWSGALRFGFTIHDPAQMKPEDIPKYACPDLVTRPGYWAKALPERFAQRDNILAFWVDRQGRVFYSVNDEDPILFHCGVKVSSPLWALIDVYGITQEVQILDSMFADTMPPGRLSSPRLSTCLPQSSHDSANFNNNELENNQVVAKIANLNLSRVPPPTDNHAIPCCPNRRQRTQGMPTLLDMELHFHSTRGADITLSSDRSVAYTNWQESNRTIVFTERPVHIGETLFIETGTVQSNVLSPSGSPSGSQYDSDSDMAFSVNRSSSASESSLVTAPSSPLSPPVSPVFAPEPQGSKDGECAVCFDNEVETVIYTCGHMCLCSSCGLKLKRQMNACCPICRRVIKDVIKTYRP